MHHLRDPDPSLASVLTISILSIWRQSTIYSWGPIPESVVKKAHFMYLEFILLFHHNENQAQK